MGSYHRTPIKHTRIQTKAEPSRTEPLTETSLRSVNTSETLNVCLLLNHAATAEPSCMNFRREIVIWIDIFYIFYTFANITGGTTSLDRQVYSNNNTYVYCIER